MFSQDKKIFRNFRTNERPAANSNQTIGMWPSEAASQIYRVASISVSMEERFLQVIHPPFGQSALSKHRW